MDNNIVLNTVATAKTTRIDVISGIQCTESKHWKYWWVAF